MVENLENKIWILKLVSRHLNCVCQCHVLNDFNFLVKTPTI